MTSGRCVRGKDENAAIRVEFAPHRTSGHPSSSPPTRKRQNRICHPGCPFERKGCRDVAAACRRLSADRKSGAHDCSGIVPSPTQRSGHTSSNYGADVNVRLLFTTAAIITQAHGRPVFHTRGGEKSTNGLVRSDYTSTSCRPYNDAGDRFSVRTRGSLFLPPSDDLDAERIE